MKRFVLGSASLLFCATMFLARASGDQEIPPVMHFNSPTPPAALARIQQAEADDRHGETAMQAGDFATAAADFKQAISDDLNPSGYLYYDLAMALTAQGHITEAIQTYRTLFYELPVKNCIGCDNPAIVEAYQKEFSRKLHADPTRYSRFGSDAPDAWMRYALLLDQTGQWKEAVYFYESALPDVPGGELPRIDAHFDPAVPQPVALAAAVHVALGIKHAFRGELDGDDKAMQEYQKALQLAPNWGIANYYYGYGWRSLSPKSKAKLLNEQQARAAFAKAVKYGKGDLKKAAEKALKDLGKPATKPA